MAKMMKALSLVLVFFVMVIFSHAWAEAPKEGESDYKAAMSATYRTILMEKERIHMQFEVYGVVTEAKEDSPLYNATFYALGQLHAVKGEYNESGFLFYTRPDGDKIYATYEASGILRRERKLKMNFVGGDGKYLGITGSGEFTGIQGLRPPKEGVGMSISVGKYNWKLP